MSVYLLTVLFPPASVIPPMLHIRLHLYVALTKRTNGQSLGTFLKAVLCQKSWSV